MKGRKTRLLVVLTTVAALVLAVSLPATAKQLDPISSGDQYAPEGSGEQSDPEGSGEQSDPSEGSMFGPGGPTTHLFGPEGPIISGDDAEAAPTETPYCVQPYVLETEWQYACSSHPLMLEQSPDGSSITVEQYGNPSSGS
jgi:hypothetical protein